MPTNPALSLPEVQLTAMDNAREGISISDARLPDNPLIYVNKGFLEMTGYDAADCIGRNCRYLQGAETDPATVEQIRHAIENKRSFQGELLNYTNEGKPFWNYLLLTPIFDESGSLIHYIGIQEDITARKELLKKKANLKAKQLIANATIDAQEMERREIGRELHDNINQIIATIGMYLDMAIKQPDSNSELLTFAKSLSDTLIQEVRRVSHQLVGPVWGESTLADSIHTLLDSLSAVISFSAHFNMDPALEEMLSERQKIMIYRIIQEQLNNIQKYACAQNVSVDLVRSGMQAMLTIRDDGKGFDASAAIKGIGLRNMRNRVELENGDLDIETAPGKGCLIRAQFIPFSNTSV